MNGFRLFGDSWTSVALMTLLLSLVHLPIAASKEKVMAFFQSTCESASPNPCQQNCTNLHSGGFICKCFDGYSINPDGMSCSPHTTETTPLPERSSNQGHGYAIPAEVNEDGEVVIKDSEVQHLKSIDLTQGLPPLESASLRRRPDESQVELSPEYNHPQSPSEPSVNDVWKADWEASSLTGTQDVVGDETFRAHRHFVEENSQTCLNNGTQYTTQDGTLSCNCPLFTYGDQCEQSLEVRFPKFEGDGYLALPVLTDAYQSFQVTIRFIPNSADGLILFSGEFSNASKDFFSVTLNEGLVEFRFDCGSGMGIVKTPNSVSMGQLNEVNITRTLTKGTVQLNDGPQASGTSQAEMGGITLRLNLYLGGYSNVSDVSTRVGVNKGLDGCVEKLIINQRSYYFGSTGKRDAQFGMNVAECSEATCDNVRCENNGVCGAKSINESICLCPLGFHGERCEKDSVVHIPHFSGHSFLEFRGLIRKALSYTEVEIIFKPTSSEGLIFYNGDTSSTDFFSLGMKEGHLEFMFDLGTGPAILRSLEPLQLDRWHLIQASRTGTLGTLIVNGKLQVTSESLGAYNQLTLMGNMFVGGHPTFQHISVKTNVKQSFTGCIQKIVINKKELDLIGNSHAGKNIAPCQFPCNSQPCMNGGECHAKLADTFVCSCPLGFESSNCEKEQDNVPSVPMFFDHSYMMFKDDRIASRVSGFKINMEMYIKPRSLNGLILWIGDSSSNNINNDFMALGFNDGSLQLSYDLGSGEATVGYNDSHLFNGEWHHIRLERNRQRAWMEIDKRELVEGASPGDFIDLNTGEIVYLGGMPDIKDKTALKFTKGFDGCIKDLTLDKNFTINFSTHVEDGRSISKCKKSYFVH